MSDNILALSQKLWRDNEKFNLSLKLVCDIINTFKVTITSPLIPSIQIHYCYD